MKKMLSLLIAAVMLIGVVPLTAPAYAAPSLSTYDAFGTSAIYGPESLPEYPQAGTTVVLTNGLEVALEDDGDVPYYAEYQVDNDLIDEYKTIIQGMLMMGASYRRLMDLFGYEVIVDLDPALSPKQDGGSYVYTYDSDFLEADDENVTVEDGRMVIPCVTKLKFADSTDDEAVFTAIKSEMNIIGTAAFTGEDAYEAAKNDGGNIATSFTIRVYPPEEAQARLDSSGNYESALMKLIVQALGADALKGTHPNKYLELDAEPAVTPLASAGSFVKIDPTGSYKMHEDGHAIFWLVNANDEITKRSKSTELDLVYTVYSDEELTTVSTNDAEAHWSVEMAGGFQSSQFGAEMEGLVPENDTIWSASASVNANTAYSQKSGVYKVTVTVGDSSDWCYVVVPGDINRDGQLLIGDSTAIKYFVVNGDYTRNITKDDFTAVLSDMNEDELILIADASRISSIIVNY